MAGSSGDEIAECAIKPESDGEQRASSDIGTKNDLEGGRHCGVYIQHSHDCCRTKVRLGNLGNGSDDNGNLRREILPATPGDNEMNIHAASEDEVSESPGQYHHAVNEDHLAQSFPAGVPTPKDVNPECSLSPEESGSSESLNVDDRTDIELEEVRKSEMTFSSLRCVVNSSLSCQTWASSAASLASSTSA